MMRRMDGTCPISTMSRGWQERRKVTALAEARAACTGTRRSSTTGSRGTPTSLDKARRTRAVQMRRQVILTTLVSKEEDRPQNLAGSSQKRQECCLWQPTHVCQGQHQSDCDKSRKHKLYPPYKVETL